MYILYCCFFLASPRVAYLYNNPRWPRPEKRTQSDTPRFPPSLLRARRLLEPLAPITDCVATSLSPLVPAAEMRTTHCPLFHSLVRSIIFSYHQTHAEALGLRYSTRCTNSNRTVSYTISVSIQLDSQCHRPFSFIRPGKAVQVCNISNRF